MIGLIIALIFFIGLSIFSTFYLIRWARIIMSLEDQLAEAIEIHERSIATFDKVLKMPLFFDSPEVKPVIAEAFDDIRLCMAATQSLIRAFTRMSKQQYTISREDDNDNGSG